MSSGPYTLSVPDGMGGAICPECGECASEYTVFVHDVELCFGYGGSDPNGTYHFIGLPGSYTMVEIPPVDLFFTFNCAIPDPMLPGDVGQLFLNIQDIDSNTLFDGTVPFSTAYPINIPNRLIVCGPDSGGDIIVAINGSADITSP